MYRAHFNRGSLWSMHTCSTLRKRAMAHFACWLVCLALEPTKKGPHTSSTSSVNYWMPVAQIERGASTIPGISITGRALSLHLSYVLLIPIWTKPTIFCFCFTTFPWLTCTIHTWTTLTFTWLSTNNKICNYLKLKKFVKNTRLKYWQQIYIDTILQFKYFFFFCLNAVWSGLGLSRKQMAVSQFHDMTYDNLISKTHHFVTFISEYKKDIEANSNMLFQSKFMNTE